MLPLEYPDRIQVSFDDHRLVANAGLILPVTLAQHLGLREFVDSHVDLGVAPGRANTGNKIVTLVAFAMAGGDCIDATDASCTGRMARVLGCVVKAPSTPAFARAGSGDVPAQLPVGPRPSGSTSPRSVLRPTCGTTFERWAGGQDGVLIPGSNRR